LLDPAAWQEGLEKYALAMHLAVALVDADGRALGEAQKKALQAERLAAIGQVAAGLAHESRNALQRSQACLERLRYRLGGQPEALDLLDRLQKAQDDLHRLYEDVREYAAPIRLNPCACDLAQVWREAWADLAPLRNGREAQLREETEGVDLRCVASPFHLKQVFRNLLDNALSAGVDPVRVVIRCSPARIEGGPAVQVAVRDNGPGFTEGQREKLFEPFATTKVHGTGLGLAICKRIVEAHGGRIAVGGGAAPGAEVLVTLPRGGP
jgi:signal transduction histidine kinase